MNEVLALFGVLAGLAAVLANIALWTPRRLWTKLGALAVTAVLFPTGYFGLSEMLSRPKPIELEFARTSMAEASVLGARMEENKAIYLWLGLPGTEEPRAYALPWNQQLARQLQGAEREAQENGSPVRMRKPFENSLDEREQRFYAAPPPPPPEKDAPADTSLNFQNSESPRR